MLPPDRTQRSVYPITLMLPLFQSDGVGFFATMGNQRKSGTMERKVEETAHHSSLVGKIVEKGFSSTTSHSTSIASFPSPTVLPFPVARHRSHGPHWTPSGAVADDEDEIEEDRDETDYNPIASFAKPVQKKVKKGMDLSRWRELVSEEGKMTKVTSSTVLVKKVKSCTRSKEVGIKSEVTKVEAAESNGKECSLVLTNSEAVGIGVKDRMIDVNSKVEVSRSEGSSRDTVDSSAGVSCASVYARTESLMASKTGELASPSLVDDIDAENHARLNDMSQDEIAEAQAEMMNKMDPAILEMLKKRGRDKLEAKKASRASNEDKESYSLKRKSQVGGKSSLTKESVSAIGNLQPSSASDGGVWKVWSEVVERTRELRFSLDANIVESEHFKDQTDESCQYKVENVTERDFLRTEGDPLAAGYTIKEAVALSRSVIPGQRAFALQLLASVLDRALNSLQKQNIRLNMRNTVNTTKQIDWQAVWAYSLGPEPEISLSLRIALDDNHISVVLASTKVIECILGCHLNENYYNISEKPFIHQKSVCTAPVFRARPEIANGFLHSGFWKYNTKPSNVLPLCENTEDEGKHTIQDDVVVAGQDVAAGLIRMGVLPRICYLLEMDPLPSLEDSLLSILIGLARHSPMCTSAIVKCPRLLEVVVSRFTKFTSSIKSVVLMRVLSEADRQNCVDFINCGFFQQITWQLFKPPVSLDDWIKSGRENCILTSGLMTQQLGLWKVYIKYGYCLAYFPDFFPAMCFWLNPPDFNRLMDKNVLGEFMSVAMEAYLVLAALSQRLPNLHSLEQLNKHAKTFPVDSSTDTWFWNHAVPIVDIGIKWLTFKDSPLAFGSDGLQNSSNETLLACRILEVVSAVMHMLSSIFNRIAAADAVCLNNDGKDLPWLPDFVPKVGLKIVKNGFLNLLNSSGSKYQIIGGRCSLANKLCQWRLHGDFEMSLASVSCLHGLVCLSISTDRLIQRAKASKPDLHVEGTDLSLEGKILEEGITKWAQNELTEALNLFVDLITLRWQDLQFVEMFGRGGPAPGVGVGWGSSGGGFWSTAVFLAGADARLILSLLEIFPISTDKDLSDFIAKRSMNDQTSEFLFPILQKISSVLEICIVIRPEDKSTLEKAFNILLQGPIFKFLDFCTRHFLHLKGYKPFEWHFMHDDFLLFGNVLNQHFKNRWLRIKKKSSQNMGESNLNSKTSKKKAGLETIDEESEPLEVVSKHQDNSLRAEWAHQRLPLPMHWFLSPISTVGDIETAQCLLSSSKIQNKDIMPSEHASDVVRGGVFFLLGLEAMCHFLCIRTLDSPVMGVPLVWKLHALSMALLVKIEIFNEQKFRDVFEALQTVYGEYLVRFRYQSSEQHSEGSAATSENISKREAQLSCREEILDFQAQVHESYSTFIETLVEQFASISYGDAIYGRQIAMYLYRTVGASDRLAAWNALTNAHVLQLLPPLESCMGEAEGYLEPIEDNEGILEAYIKSWVTGALDKAATRGSMSFSLALHHLSSFIFHCHSHDKLILRNKMVRSILRGFSRKQNQEDMVLRFINYERQTPQQHNAEQGISYQGSERERRFMILSEACEGNSSLLSELEKLRSSTS